MKHYSANQSMSSIKPKTVKSSHFSMGAVALAGTVLTVALVVFLDFNDPASEVKAADQAFASVAAAVPFADRSAEPVASKCNDTSINPFASKSPCTDITKPEHVVNGRTTHAETRAMIESAISGNVAMYQPYWNHSRNCRKAHAAMDKERTECDLAVLEADDLRFMGHAERLAADGNTHAQVALGQLWLATAMFSAVQKPMPAQDSAQRDTGFNNSSEHSMPSNAFTLTENGSLPIDPAFQPPNLLVAAQKAAFFFTLAASNNPEAADTVEYLKSKGVRPFRN